VLGRLKMYQYLLLGLLFVPCYAFNEWLLLSGGLGLIPKGSFLDTGGSILIHAFGALSTLGFAVIQGRLQGKLRKVDTCGVLYLHGLPGLFGGLAAMVAVGGISRRAEIEGIAITVALAILLGLVVGRILALVGRRKAPCIDSEEFVAD
jgi:ammonia channel protein AmtB